MCCMCGRECLTKYAIISKIMKGKCWDANTICFECVREEKAAVRKLIETIEKG